MSIRYEHTHTVATSADKAFAAIDDLPLTAQWLPPCTSLAKVGDGLNAPGDRLRYVYRQGGSEFEMKGEILACTPGQRLLCQYADALFRILVDLRVAPAVGGASISHVIEISPQTFLGKLMSPLIRLGVGKQTRDAARNLKRLLEATSN
jgi:hypothetical protein